MDLKPQAAPAFSKKEQKFKKRLEKVLSGHDLTLQRDLITRITAQSGVELIDCAAALVLLSQANLYHAAKDPDDIAQTASGSLGNNPKSAILQPLKPPKMIRYRIEVGSKHNICVDEIKTVFVTEAGVDKKMIGEVDIRHHYTLVELPEGMPPDIYHLLTTVSIAQQKLNIKRLKHHDRHHLHLHHKKKVGKGQSLS
jgi:ATP-dependent RNA helicase DeaD